MLRWWAAYEQMLLAKMIRFPLSTTPRERMLMLGVIRLVALSIALLIFGLLSISMGAFTGWSAGAVAGAELYVMGLTLLALAMAVGVLIVIVYGD